MANFSIPVTVPDDKVADMLSATQRRFGLDALPTPAEARQAWQRYLHDQMREAYRTHKRRQAAIDNITLT